MPINLKLPSLDNNPILLAETRSNRINEFIQRLPFGDPVYAANDLIDELQILNVSAGGYALRKFNSSQASARVGDVVAMKNSKKFLWELAALRWANVKNLNQLDIGLGLFSPSATAISAKLVNNA